MLTYFLLSITIITQIYAFPHPNQFLIQNNQFQNPSFSLPYPNYFNNQVGRTAPKKRDRFQSFTPNLNRNQIQSCPTGSSKYSNLHTGSFQISTSFTSDVRLIDGQDITCYNYTLPNPFLKEPTVAVAIKNFQAQNTPDLFFAVRPIWSYQFVKIPFQVRTQWKYSKWIRIVINFLIENRDDIQANFYDKGTGLVGSCGTFKVQPIYLPFTQSWDPNPSNLLTIRLFLNGFQISSFKNSPFQLRLTQFGYNRTGISFKLVVNSDTAVNSISVSYIVFQKNSPNFKSINGFYQQLNPKGSSYSTNLLTVAGSQISHSGATFKAENSFYGIIGFEIPIGNNQITFKSELDLNTFQLNFDFNGLFYKYIGVQYILFSSTPCGQCPGFPYYHNGLCLKSCPEGTINYGDTCFSCPTNSYLNNNRCICNPGYYNISGECTTCPLGQTFFDGICQGCGKNQLWVGNLCQCQSGYYNISGQCVACPKGAYWNGNTCTSCGPNSYYFAGKCQCNPGFSNMNGMCTKCPSGSVFNGKQCTIPCKPGQIWDGRRCQSLCRRTRNSFWNGIQCICNDGFFKLLDKCISCPNGKGKNGNCSEDNNNVFVSFNKKEKGQKASKDDKKK